MQNLALSWQQAGALAAGLLAGATALHACRHPRLRAVAPLLREAAMISALYAVWQLVGTLSVVGDQDALARARWIERTERALRLPSEAGLQDALTGHSAIAAQFANIYYATMHFGALFVFLLWLFLRHRERYRPVRRVLAVTTLACLLIQFMPVAPPRMLPGFVDTAARYGQSVYGGGFAADQLSAMPSIHVAWAVLIAWAAARVGRGAWRWLGCVHAVVTVLVVVSTANHFWADGIVAVAVLAVSIALCRAVEAAWRRRLRPEPAEECDGQVLSPEPEAIMLPVKEAG